MRVVGVVNKKPVVGILLNTTRVVAVGEAGARGPRVGADLDPDALRQGVVVEDDVVDYHSPLAGRVQGPLGPRVRHTGVADVRFLGRCFQPLHAVRRAQVGYVSVQVQKVDPVESDRFHNFVAATKGKVKITIRIVTTPYTAISIKTLS